MFPLLVHAEIIPCGSDWINIHKDNKNLVGIYVQQYPDNIKDRNDYEGKHPVMIIYVFKDNNAHTVTYSPIGQIQNGVWHKINNDHWVMGKISQNYNEGMECHYSLK